MVIIKYIENLKQGDYMKTIKTLTFIFILMGTFAGYNSIYADGCYICGSGSSSNCKDYCRYSGSDSFENRKKCEKAGCKISGTSSCPTAANYKVCSAWNESPSLYEKLVYNFLKK